MDKEIDAQFNRVEKALSTLITSIATYNPSPQLAQDLVTADASLSAGLQKLSTHQANSARIIALRATTAALDSRLRNTLVQLTQTRSELLAIPSTSLPAHTNAVTYTELLSYARRISKFSLPPTWRDPLASAAAEAGAPNNGEAKTPNSEGKTPVNGATPSATPVLANGVLPGGMVASPGKMENGDAHTTALPEHLNAHLSPVASFVPWPTEETIRRGALANIQTLLNEGVDPATFDPERVAELEAMTREREAEEEDKRAREEEERRLEMERRMGGGRRGTVEEQEPRIFTGLDMLEDDDDD